MKIIIGIYQNQEDAETIYRQQAVDREAITETGPFYSRDQALSWMDYLAARIAEYELREVPDERAESGSWYGYTIEMQSEPVALPVHGK